MTARPADDHGGHSHDHGGPGHSHDHGGPGHSHDHGGRGGPARRGARLPPGTPNRGGAAFRGGHDHSHAGGPGHSHSHGGRGGHGGHGPGMPRRGAGGPSWVPGQMGLPSTRGKASPSGALQFPGFGGDPKAPRTLGPGRHVPLANVQNMSEAERNAHEELLYFNSVIKSFSAYRFHTMVAFSMLERRLVMLPPAHLKLLSGPLVEKYKKLRSLLPSNVDLITDMIRVHHDYDNPDDLYKEAVVEQRRPVPREDVSKVRTTLKMLVRDWSADGLPERNATYSVILDELKRLYGDQSDSRNAVSVFVPGSGVGRLAFEIAKAGFKSQGNEFSYHMLVASHWVLNLVKGPHTIYPYIHVLSNVKETNDIYRPVVVPDAPPSLPEGTEFSMVAGEFSEVYGAESAAGAWDSCVTCFFIDTAPDVLDYMETIWHALKMGGTWVNLGPLLYHYTDDEEEGAVELSWEEIKALLPKMGFELDGPETWHDCPYTRDAKSMYNFGYTAVKFTARKIARPALAAPAAASAAAPAAASSVESKKKD